MSVWNFLGDALGLGYEVYKDQHLTGAQREANRFNASEAHKQREFASAEAEAARAWQEHMYTEYESPQALMRQAQEAGINPAAVYGDALGGSAPSASAPSGSAASSVTPSGGDVVGMVQALTNIKLAQADIKYKEQLGKESASKIELNSKTVEKLDSDINKAAADVDYINQMIKESNANIELKEVQRALYEAQKILTQKQGEIIDTEMFYNEWRNAFIVEHGTTPEIRAQRQAAWIQVSGMAANALINQAGGFLTAKYAGFGRTVEGSRSVTTTDPTTGEVKSLLDEIFKQTTK